MELLEDAKEKEEGEEKEEVPLKPQKETKVEEKVLKCTTCGETAIFGTAHEQRKHFKE